MLGKISLSKLYPKWARSDVLGFLLGLQQGGPGLKKKSQKLGSGVFKEMVTQVSKFISVIKPLHNPQIGKQKTIQ